MIFDYFDRRVPRDAAHEARVIPNECGGDSIAGIRAARGLVRGLPWSRLDLHPEAERTPLVHLPTFEPAPASRPRAKKSAAPSEPSEALLGAIEAELARAYADSRSAWEEAVERAPRREELAHALWNVLAASADHLLMDPGRIEEVPPRSPTASATSASRPDEIVVREPHGIDQILVTREGRSLALYPFREGTQLIVETYGADGELLAAVGDALGAWRRERGMPEIAEEVVVRPITWGEPTRFRA